MNDWLMASLAKMLTLCGEELRTDDLTTAIRQAHTMVRGALIHLILADDTINRHREDMRNSDQIEEMVWRTVSSFLSPSADNNGGMRLEGQDGFELGHVT